MEATRKMPVLRNIAPVMLLAPVALAQQTVTVTDGSGSGSYPVGATVHIWGNLNTANQVFDRWTGDTTLLSDAGEAHMLFTMPARAVTFRATYKDSAEWRRTEEMVNGIRLWYYFPPNPVGLIFRFHTKGGNVRQIFDQPEGQIFNRTRSHAGTQ